MLTPLLPCPLSEVTKLDLLVFFPSAGSLQLHQDQPLTIGSGALLTLQDVPRWPMTSHTFHPSEVLQKSLRGCWKGFM